MPPYQLVCQLSCHHHGALPSQKPPVREVGCSIGVLGQAWRWKPDVDGGFTTASCLVCIRPIRSLLFLGSGAGYWARWPCVGPKRAPTAGRAALGAAIAPPRAAARLPQPGSMPRRHGHQAMQATLPGYARLARQELVCALGGWQPVHTIREWNHPMTPSVWHVPCDDGYGPGQ